MKKKYKKFVASAATATLVASAIVPAVSAASFSDTAGNTHELAIESLVNQGIISGYPDGTFKPNRTLTRSDVVKLLGKYLVSQGYKVPADYKTKMRFTDLRSTSQDELLQYAALVKDNGVFNGSNGNLLPNDSITRENMAVVLVRAYTNINGFDYVGHVQKQNFKEDVVDYNAAKAEARSAIRVLDYYNVTGVPNFNPKGSTTRGQFSSFLFKMLQVEAPGADFKAVEVVDASTLRVTLDDDTVHTVRLETALEEGKETSITFDIGEKKYTAMVTYKANLTVKTVEVTGANTLKVTLSDNSEHNVTLENNLPENEETTVSFKIDGKDYTTKVTYTVTEVKVASAKALNGGQVEIKFNQRVNIPANLTQAQISNYITIMGVDNSNPISFTQGQLSEDGRTLTISTNGMAALSGRYVVKVKDVKNSAGTSVTPYDEIINFGTDTVAPTLLSTVNRDAKTVRVTFSEPLRSFSNSSITFRLANGTNVTGITGDIGTGSWYADFDLSNAMVNGQQLAANTPITVTFAGLRDIAGNFSSPNPLTTSFTMGGADGVKPTLTSISQTGPRTFKLTFSERIRKPAIADLELRLGTSVNPITAIDEVSGDNRSFTITSTNDLNGVYNIGTAPGKTITDISGETNTFATTHSFTIDTTAPQVTATTVTRDGNFEYLDITLNREVNLVDASRVTASGSYVKNGVTHSITGTPTNLVYKDNNRSVLRVKLDDLLGAGDADNANYNVTLSFTELKSAYGVNVTNKAVSFPRTADYVNNNNVLGTPTVTTSTADPTLTNNQVRLVFNHDLDATTAAVASNYSIPNAKIAHAQVLSGALNTVILTLEPNETTSSGPRNLIITGVKAKDSLANQQNLTAEVNLKENIRPVLNTITALSANEIELSFSENVSGIDTNSFVVENASGTSLSIASVASSTKGNKVTVTLTDNLSAGATVTIKKGAGVEAVKDEAGNALVDTFNLQTTLLSN